MYFEVKGGLVAKTTVIFRDLPMKLKHLGLEVAFEVIIYMHLFQG